MKNSLIISGLIIISILFTPSCDSRKDFFIGMNVKPNLSIFKQGVLIGGDVLDDSLKIGVNYSLTYTIQDEETLPIINTVKNGNASVTVNGNNITVTSQANGSSIVELYAKDSFDQTSVFKLNLTIFTNLKPIARISITKIGLESPYEYEFDGSASYDQDKKFNGSVTDYTFNLQNYVVSTKNSKIRYIFGSSGQKLIKFKVKDNNGEFSEEISEYLFVN